MGRDPGVMKTGATDMEQALIIAACCEREMGSVNMGTPIVSQYSAQVSALNAGMNSTNTVTGLGNPNLLRAV